MERKGSLWQALGDTANRIKDSNEVSELLSTITCEIFQNNILLSIKFKNLLTSYLI